jgi:hypothetical protein
MPIPSSHLFVVIRRTRVGAGSDEDTSMVCRLALLALARRLCRWWEAVCLQVWSKGLLTNLKNCARDLIQVVKRENERERERVCVCV